MNQTQRQELLRQADKLLQMVQELNDAIGYASRDLEDMKEHRSGLSAELEQVRAEIDKAGGES